MNHLSRNSDAVSFRWARWLLVPLALTFSTAQAASESRRSGASLLAAGEVRISIPDSESIFGHDHKDTPPNWGKILDPTGNSPVQYGVELLGPSPYAENERIYFPPASVSKIFTSLAALRYLGPSFRFTTDVQWEKTNSSHQIRNLKLFGRGDPTWGMSEFGENNRTRVNQIAEKIGAAGVQKITGTLDLFSADPRWDHLEFPEGWDESDQLKCYGALPQSFNLDVNCASYEVRGPTSGSWQSKGVATPVELSIVRGTRTNLRVEPISVNGMPNGRYLISGTWKAGSDPVSFDLPIHDAKSWIRNLLILALEEQGIVLELDRNVPFIQRAPLTDAPGFTLSSPPLSEIMKPFVKDSINFIGEDLQRKLGSVRGNESDSLLLAGQKVMKEFISTIGLVNAEFAKVTPIPGYFLDQVVLYDGCGLSKKSQVTSQALMVTLREAPFKDNFSHLWDAFPIAGVDGTLATRMKGTVAEGVVRAKTGTLTGSYHLSGYVPRFDERRTAVEFIPFIVLSQTTSSHKAEAHAAQDRVAVALTRMINSSLFLFGN
ncbi:MAG: D-alanyl-D-alanine carboxypeptidase/D-alanyl-D-alanine-endopeptidase [Methylotenera sp.]|nr:D-alanyl-D-alanine carboxypeptidase/D-alanyl-D-alanine-endopeptidase [Oligoflexia bacterium]